MKPPEWLAQEDPDVVCMQETKAQMAILDDTLYRPPGYHHFFADAEKKNISKKKWGTRKY